MGHTTNRSFNRIILGLGTYLYPMNTLSNDFFEIHYGMGKPRGLKFRRYATHTIKLNEYFAVFKRF